MSRIKTVLILHGIDGHAGIHWQQWVYDELSKKGYSVLMPTMPCAHHPNRFEWLQEIQRLTRYISPQDLIIIGHSLGVATAFDYIETLDTPLYMMISVSGFCRDYGAELNNYFLKQRSIDMKKVFSNITHAHVIYGDDDPYVPQETLREVASALKVDPVIVAKGGHLNARAGYTTLPLIVKLAGEKSRG